MQDEVARKRSQSKDKPPDLSELMDRLKALAASFIEQFDVNEDRMREIVKEITSIADSLKEIHKGTDAARKVGTTVAALGVIGILAVPVTGGLSLTAVAAAAAVGGATVGVVNKTKMMIEDGSTKKAEKLGKEFMMIIEPMKNNMEDIEKTCEEMKKSHEEMEMKHEELEKTCEELVEKSAEVQTKKALRDMEEFNRIMTRVSELQNKSKEAVVIAVTLLRIIGDALMILVNIFRVTATPEEDEKLRAAIIQSADQGQMISEEFDNIKRELNQLVFSEEFEKMMNDLRAIRAE